MSDSWFPNGIDVAMCNDLEDGMNCAVSYGGGGVFVTLHKSHGRRGV